MYNKRYDIVYDNVTYESVHKLIEITDGSDEFRHFLDIDYNGSKCCGFVGISFPRYAFESDKKNKAYELIASTLRAYN